ncbi:MAG: hypothetical protein K6G55_08860 [Selenomonadaceae bacterium]|nr:hypothetical protein [Selenomonadaceae bacterium]
MTELKQEAIKLIESIPDEKIAVLKNIVRYLRGVTDSESRQHDKLISRAEEKLALMEETENLIGEDKDK